MSEENKAIVHRFLDALWNRADFAVVDDLVADDYDGHSSTEIHGPNGAKQFVFPSDPGKLIEGWTNQDLLGLLQQLGAVPEFGQAGR